ncbi:Vitamin B12 ABC transporter, ATP-binding protein BtuD [hydrothermal vent metagenome]|uniref:Vitamin B12 ABC transporter, ATP-binding protein BtuD n=1 Tax=hydrothermal vent metagenome TaxID=652676 RepID=A0A3B0RJT3_9ZZZZ
MNVGIAGVSMRYGDREVLNDISLEVAGGSWLGIIGPNGAGKSTLLRAVAGLLPYDGSIMFDDVEIGSLDRRVVAQTVAYVPQSPVLPEGMNVTDYVLLGRTPYISHFGTESKRDLEIVFEVLTTLDLIAFRERLVTTLSGGEAQRLVLARALAQQAPLVLLDEPTTALDIGHQQDVLNLIDNLRTTQQLTVISTMHDLTLVGQFADSLVLLSGGEVVAEGLALDVLTVGLIRDHYGARVRILRDDDDRPVIVPWRHTDSNGSDA